MVNFLVLLSALVVSMALVPILLRIAHGRRGLDMPDGRKVHSQPVPRIGGIAIAVGTLLPVVLWLPLSEIHLAYLAGLVVILAFGLADDLFGLGYAWKFVGQAIAVLIVVIGGGVLVEHLPFMGLDAAPAVLAIPFTIVALIGVTNAINLADGLDGLAGGQVLLSLAAIAMLAYLADGQSLLTLSLSMGGAILGFLRYNTHPARIFMGDGGSQFLGFSIGFMVIVLTQRVHPSMSPVVALFLLGVPVIDTLTVIVQRLFERRPVFRADRNHIHHKLLALGFDHYEAVLAIYCAQALLVTLGYGLRYASDGVLLAIYLGFAAAVLAFFQLASARGWRVRAAQPSNGSFLQRQVAAMRQSRIVYRVTLAAIQVLVSILFLFIVFSVGRVPPDIGVGSLLLATTIGLSMAVKSSSRFLLQVHVYVTAVFMIYLFEVGGREYSTVVDTLIVSLAIFVIVGIRLTRGNDFRITPMDFLIVFIAILGPTLADFQAADAALASGMPKVIVVFYALEFLLHATRDRCRGLIWCTMGTLLVAGVRGLSML